MAGTFIDSQNLDISCPGTVLVGQSSVISGRASFRLVNETDTDVFFNILVHLTDTVGYRAEQSQTFQVVVANGDLTDSYSLFINENYTNSGLVTATLKIEITGAATFSDSVECNFNVV
ncbi:hypothetical protein [Nostoc sp. CALU 1950]|uniref:hypothetical protein n=1 Tax=Nostoc sp. CALU 1950 TaxID=3104321 RepID=UPI003EC11A1B